MYIVVLQLAFVNLLTKKRIACLNMFMLTTFLCKFLNILYNVQKWNTWLMYRFKFLCFRSSPLALLLLPLGDSGFSDKYKDNLISGLLLHYQRGPKNRVNTFEKQF